MKYKVGDKVKVRSREWWDKQPKAKPGYIDRGYFFTKEMSSLCGRIVTIELVDDDSYRVEETSDIWEDWMFEPAYTYAELDLPYWWDGRPVLGYVSDISEEHAKSNYSRWCIAINPYSEYRYITGDYSSNGIENWNSNTSCWKYFVPAEQESRKVCITVKENGESKEIELTEAQIKQLGL